MNQSIMKEELLHLEEVKGKLDAALAKEAQKLAEQKETLLEQRRTMWEEGAHNVKDFDDIVDMNAYDERVREEFGHYVRKDQTVRQLTYLKQTPYFGRIDFREEEEGEMDALSGEEKIYIGRYGFCTNRFEYEIYDWRSPIANMFYECSPGKASYKCPAGEITGELTCKRQYQIKDGVLEYYYDTEMAVQDELLGKVLSENTDKVLRVIIDTITRDQNRAIRQPQGTDLLITGPAGSGKTSVGMHRLAYLLYHNRASLAAEKIAVLSRNEIFSSYISGILPELGEENVQDVLFDDLVCKGISGQFHKMNYYDQVEYLLAHQEQTIRRRAIVMKYSEDFLEYINAELKQWLVSRECKQNKQFLAVRKLPETAVEVYRHLLRRYADNQEKKSVYTYTISCMDRQQLQYEDMLVIGYVRILLGGIRPMDHISHVVIDEAQDYNYLQLLIIRLLYPKSRFTILADPNQAVYPEISTIAMEVFYRIFGKNMKEMRLNKSYRSTAPINQYAFALLGIHNPQLYVDRPGKEPACIHTVDKAAAVSEILSRLSPDQSAAILTCDNESALHVKNELWNLELSRDRKIEYILRPDKILEEKTVVMPVMLAKGLEFDVVIIWDDRTEAYWEKNKHLKYLMCTRALHELYIVSE